MAPPNALYGLKNQKIIKKKMTEEINKCELGEAIIKKLKRFTTRDSSDIYDWD